MGELITRHYRLYNRLELLKQKLSPRATQCYLYILYCSCSKLNMYFVGNAEAKAKDDEQKADSRSSSKGRRISMSSTTDKGSIT